MARIRWDRFFLPIPKRVTVFFLPPPVGRIWSTVTRHSIDACIRSRKNRCKNLKPWVDRLLSILGEPHKVVRHPLASTTLGIVEGRGCSKEEAIYRMMENLKAMYEEGKIVLDESWWIQVVPESIFVFDDDDTHTVEVSRCYVEYRAYTDVAFVKRRGSVEKMIWRIRGENIPRIITGLSHPLQRKAVAALLIGWRAHYVDVNDRRMLLVIKPTEIELYPRYPPNAPIIRVTNTVDDEVFEALTELIDHPNALVEMLLTLFPI
jgi:hypothetical protein